MSNEPFTSVSQTFNQKLGLRQGHLKTGLVIAHQIRWCVNTLSLCNPALATRSLHIDQANPKSCLSTHFKPVFFFKRNQLHDFDNQTNDFMKDKLILLTVFKQP